MQPNVLETEEKLHLRFVAQLLHDLETPVAVAKHFLKRVAEGRYDPSRSAHRELLDSTQLAIHRAERILEDLLDLARQDEECLLANPAVVDFRSVLRECLEVVRPMAEENRVEIHCEIGQQVPSEVLLDAALIGRVIDNYLSNAIRHAAAETTILIRVRCADQRLNLSVINVPKENLNGNIEKIFDPAEQIRQRQSRKYRGSGLGLTFSKKAVEAHRGEVGAYQKDNEIIFWFEIPIG